MKILASSIGDRYLLVRDDVTDIEISTEARLLDLERESLFWWQNIHLIIRQTHTEWTKYEGSQNVLDDLLERVEEIESE